MNLGGILAMSKKRVVLVDMDMRKAKVNGFPNGDPGKGISSILINRNTIEECTLNTSIEGFDFVPSGLHPPNVAAFNLRARAVTVAMLRKLLNYGALEKAEAELQHWLRGH